MSQIVKYEDYKDIKASDFKKNSAMLCNKTLLISLPVFNSNVFKSRPGASRKSFIKWCEESYTQMSSNEIRLQLKEYSEWALEYITSSLLEEDISKVIIIAPKSRKQPSATASDYAMNNQRISFYERLDNFTADAIKECFEKKTKLSYFKYNNPIDLLDYIESLF